MSAKNFLAQASTRPLKGSARWIVKVARPHRSLFGIRTSKHESVEPKICNQDENRKSKRRDAGKTHYHGIAGSTRSLLRRKLQMLNTAGPLAFTPRNAPQFEDAKIHEHSALKYVTQKMEIENAKRRNGQKKRHGSTKMVRSTVSSQKSP